MTYHWSLTRVQRRVPLVEQELGTLPEHPSSVFFSGVRVVICVAFRIDHCLSFCTCLAAIVLSVRRLFTPSDYPFGVFKASNFSYYEITI